MADLKADIVVLGAGMVGVGAALHLQKRGRHVMLIDKHGTAGDETSYGNAGIIECASVFPYMFPRDPMQILRYATNRAPEARYSLVDLPAFLPWLLRYYLASAPDRALRGAMSVLPLIRQSLVEHEALVAEAGVPDLLKRTGWIKMFRSAASPRSRVARARAGEGIWRRGRSSRSKGDRAARAKSVRRVCRRDPFSGAGFRARSRRPGEGLCHAVPAQGRTVSDRRRTHAAADERRPLARRDGGGAGHGARGGRRVGAVVRSGVRAARLFDPVCGEARLSSASGAHAATPC